MAENYPSREEALELLKKYNESESLINHALAVEAVMRYAARQLGADEELWGIVGLIHDLDYEKYPDQHCTKTEEILRAGSWPEEIIRAVVSHGWGVVSDVRPESDMEKTLYAIDELTGLVTACALVRPSKSVNDLGVKSVKKKWKVKAFAAGADREIIMRGAEMLGMELGELIELTIAGMRERSDELGL
ncbi:MAG: HDIG domain-containing metalloprotein [Candidatus Kapaibacterium sp.]